MQLLKWARFKNTRSRHDRTVVSTGSDLLFSKTCVCFPSIITEITLFFFMYIKYILITSPSHCYQHIKNIGTRPRVSCSVSNSFGTLHFAALLLIFVLITLFSFLLSAVNNFNKLLKYDIIKNCSLTYKMTKARSWLYNVRY